MNSKRMPRVGLEFVRQLIRVVALHQNFRLPLGLRVGRILVKTLNDREFVAAPTEQDFASFEIQQGLAHFPLPGLRRVDFHIVRLRELAFNLQLLGKVLHSLNFLCNRTEGGAITFNFVFRERPLRGRERSSALVLRRGA